MKKCPTCGKTFDDNMRFCQTDGTPLVDDASAAAPEEPPVEEPAFDPYATIVGVPKTAMPPAEPPAEAPVEPSSASPAGEVVLEPIADAGPSSSADTGAIAGESVSSIPVAAPDDILDLGDSDPLKTMYVSDTEMKEVLGTAGADTPVEEINSDEAEVQAPSTGTDFGSISPPPSPFSEQPSAPEDMPMPAPPSFLDTPPRVSSEAETQVQQPEPAFEPEPSYQEETPTVFQPAPEPQYAPTPEPQYSDPVPAPMQNQDWTPPPAPTPEWQNQQIGSTTPFQPPPAGAGGQNKTLAIVSLVLGILSICCYVGPLTGLVALILGFMAYKKAGDDPQNYGGKGLALAGMITGGLFMVTGVVYYILIIIGVAAGGFR